MRLENLFIGYIPSVGKAPIDKVIGGTYLTEPPKTGDYVGVLNPKVIQLDFDNEEDSEIILKIVKDYRLQTSILKTTRGVHLYFLQDGHTKNTSSGGFNAIGLKVDVGLGHKNRVVPLRVTREVERITVKNGKEITDKVMVTKDREWIQTYDTLEVIPAYLRPIGKIDFGLKKTDTRNQTLFEYILELQRQAFSQEETRKTIRMINQYVLYKPLSDSEIDTITRDGAFSQEIFFDGKVFKHDRFGDYLLSNANIMLLDEQLCIYTKEGIYSNDILEFNKVMIDKISDLKDANRLEVYKYLELKCNKKGRYSNAKYIGLKDDILDIETMERFPYSPKFIINNKIPYNYNPDAYHELMDKTLDKVACGDKQVRMLLEEMIGYALYRENTMQMAFILTGGGSNGKSTVLDLIKELIGKPNYTSLDLRELETTFTPAELHNKLANIGDDISAKYLETSSIFKKVVTGESFMAQRKYGQPFELESYATQIFCANELPPVNDRTDGFSRRITIIPFTAKFGSSDDENYDPFIKDKLMTEQAIEYLLKIAIDGLKRVLINREFTKSSRGEMEKNEFVIQNNPVLRWIEEGAKVENETVKDVYETYQQWCHVNGYRNPLSVVNFGREISKELNVVSKMTYVPSLSKSIRMYVREEEEVIDEE